MKTELSFLMDLFLNDEVPPPIKKLVSARIREVEKYFTTKEVAIPKGAMQSIIHAHGTPVNLSPVVAAQSPSMQKIMERNADLLPPVVPPSPSTAAAAQALANRANLIRGASNEKPEPGRNGPRKF